MIFGLRQMAKTINYMEEIIVPIVFFASIFGIVYVFLSTRHRERIALIEKGADPEIYKNAFKGNRVNSFTLKLGLTAVGIALGILLGAILTAIFPGIKEEVANISMIFLFGGSAMIASYFLERRLTKQDAERK